MKDCCIPYFIHYIVTIQSVFADRNKPDTALMPPRPLTALTTKCVSATFKERKRRRGTKLNLLWFTHNLLNQACGEIT